MRVVELSGGVGGARLARGLAALGDVDLTVVVNVGDDADNHGFHISPDLDTVVYTLAGEEGHQGWGRAGDTFHFNDELARFGVDNNFRLGDRDLALKVFRTVEMGKGTPLSKVTSLVTDGFGIGATVLPVTDDRLRTEVRLHDGWVSFQEYFVARGHRDEVHDIRFAGADRASPAPGVIEAIATADYLFIGPSNPPLSIWPMLAVPGIRQAVQSHPAVTAVSPLIGGKTVKGPADRVMSSLGLGTGNGAVLASYDGLIHRLVIDQTDAAEADRLPGVELRVTETLIVERAQAARLAGELLGR